MVEQHLRDLLYDHDCVVLEGLGGFTTQLLPAEVHPASHTFQPTAQRVGFNEKLRTDDGLLVRRLAEREGLSPEAATQRVKEFVYAVKQALRDKNEYAFDTLGTLYINAEYSLSFRPSETLNLHPDSFGLPTFQVRPFARQTPPPDQLPTADDTLPRRPARRRAERSGSRAFALWPLLLGLTVVVIGGLVYWLVLAPQTASEVATTEAPPDMSFAEPSVVEPTDVPPDANDEDAFGGFEAEPSETNATEEPTPDEPRDEPAQDALAGRPATGTPAAGTPAAQPTPVATPDPTPAATLPTRDFAEPGDPKRYYVIVGGFKTAGRAQRLRRRLAEARPEATVIRPRKAGEPFRVAVAYYPSADDARAALDELKAAYGADIWILKY